jgi:hypothetical protein
MILRRLTTALRKQDGFTGLVETPIIVFGVLIIPQVNNRNEARQERWSASDDTWGVHICRHGLQCGR